MDFRRHIPAEECRLNLEQISSDHEHSVVDFEWSRAETRHVGQNIYFVIVSPPKSATLYTLAEKNPGKLPVVRAHSAALAQKCRGIFSVRAYA